MSRPAFAAALLLTLAACAPPPVNLPSAPVAAGPAITIAATPLPLNPEDPAQDRVGDFVYAGGLELTARDTARLHGLSDLRVSPDGDLLAVSDEGDLVESRVVLDKAGRLVGIGPARLSVLTDLDGKPLQGKLASDSEGLAVLANGDRLVSFEQNHRIWLYPAKGGPPRVAPSPDEAFPANAGMEALAADPAAGPDAYVTAGEDSGHTWTCRLPSACVAGPELVKPPEFGVVAVNRLPNAQTAWMTRAWDPVRGSRIVVQILGPAGQIDRLDLARPLTVDNFEGLSAVPGRNGAIRFYLISDDNFQSSQRTLLLAFDWSPPRP